MAKYYDPNRDELTSTLNVTSLRPVPSELDPKEKLSSQERSIISKLNPGTAMFLILAGPGKGSRYLIDSDEVSIGREPSNEIFLDDITVSRKHAKLRKKSSYIVEDLNSLNGTYLNADSVSKASLKNGDELQVGKFRLTFFIADESKGR
jgi:pSer/pThr/pTyr-binding forkhead associated (FHA) protein